MATSSDPMQRGDAPPTRRALRLSAAERRGTADRPCVQLEGEFDLDTVPEIDRFLRRTLGPLYHQDHLVIDLARTTFVDSSFVAFLVRLSAAQRAKRRELLLVRPAGQVRKVFGIVGAGQRGARVRDHRGRGGQPAQRAPAGDPAGLRGRGR